MNEHQFSIIVLRPGLQFTTVSLLEFGGSIIFLGGLGFKILANSSGKTEFTFSFELQKMDL
jgi:hypothetical protein